jgi:hypothetical protein
VSCARKVQTRRCDCVNLLFHRDRKCILASSSLKRPVSRRSSSVRALYGLVGLALISLCVGLWWRYERTQANYTWLKERGAQFSWQHEFYDHRQLARQKFQLSLVPIFGSTLISDIATVKIVDPQATDLQLAQLAAMPNLYRVVLESDQATDATVRHLANMHQLRSLSLGGQQFTFEGLLELRKLTKLRQLILSDMRLTRAELAVLENALPQANLVYNRRGVGEVYQREVFARYPRVQRAQPGPQARFEPLVPPRVATERSGPLDRTPAA